MRRTVLKAGNAEVSTKNGVGIATDPTLTDVWITANGNTLRLACLRRTRRSAKDMSPGARAGAG